MKKIIISSIILFSILGFLYQADAQNKIKKPATIRQIDKKVHHRSLHRTHLHRAKAHEIRMDAMKKMAATDGKISAREKKLLKRTDRNYYKKQHIIRSVRHKHLHP